MKNDLRWPKDSPISGRGSWLIQKNEKAQIPFS